MAAKLGLAVGGGGDASYKSRVLVAEFSRSKSVASEQGQTRYGVAARMVVRVRNFGASANMTLPFVAAQAQFNQLEASAALHVEGYVGAAGKEFPNFGEFNVESYVKLMDSLSTLKNRIGDDTENIRPVRLWVWGEDPGQSQAVDAKMTRAVGIVWALTQITDGASVEDAVTRYEDHDDQTAQVAIRQTYSDLLGGDAKLPGEQARAHARDLLDGYRAKTSWFRT